MSLPDTAEYWWDVKGYNRSFKHTFTHIKGIECGRYHVAETDVISHIDCKNCKKILAEMPEIKKDIEDKYEKRAFPNGKCQCGGAFVERTNKSNGNKFFGCSKYPKCKKTKN